MSAARRVALVARLFSDARPDESAGVGGDVSLRWGALLVAVLRGRVPARLLNDTMQVAARLVARSGVRWVLETPKLAEILLLRSRVEVSVFAEVEDDAAGGSGGVVPSLELLEAFMLFLIDGAIAVGGENLAPGVTLKLLELAHSTLDRTFESVLVFLGSDRCEKQEPPAAAAALVRALGCVWTSAYLPPLPTNTLHHQPVDGRGRQHSCGAPCRRREPALAFLRRQPRIRGGFGAARIPPAGLGHCCARRQHAVP